MTSAMAMPSNMDFALLDPRLKFAQGRQVADAGQVFDLRSSAPKESLPADEHRHLGKGRPDFRGGVDKRVHAKERGDGKRDHIRSFLRHELLHFLYLRVCAQEVTAPAVQFEKVGYHLGADLMIFINRAGDDRRLAEARLREESGIGQVQ